MPAADDSVHLWLVRLDPPQADVDNLWESLSADERARAARFVSPKDRDRFIVGRGLLRTLLGRCRQCAPESLEFCYNAAGKPSLSDTSNPEQLQFNLSHAGDVMLLGVTLGRRIGVDIERVDAETDCESLAKRFFSASEWETLETLAPPERRAAWFRFWTVKEAYLKAVGIGLRQPLNTVEVADGQPPRLIRIGGDTAAAARWQSLPVAFCPDGFAASVVIEGKVPLEIQCYLWER